MHVFTAISDHTIGAFVKTLKFPLRSTRATCPVKIMADKVKIKTPRKAS